MRILCLADIHARFEAVVPSKLPDPEGIDLVLIAGDITNLGARHPLEVKRAAVWLGGMAARYPQVRWVPGNHDIDITPDTFAAVAPNCRCLLHVEEQLGGLRLYGESLAVCFDRPHYEQDWDYMTADPKRDLAAWERAPVADIVVSHSPPHHVRDTTGPCRQPDGKKAPSYIGSPGLRAYIERHEPRLVLCGHVHEAFGEETLGKTRVYNVAQRHACLEL